MVWTRIIESPVEIQGLFMVLGLSIQWKPARKGLMSGSRKMDVGQCRERVAGRTMDSCEDAATTHSRHAGGESGAPLH